MTRLDPVHPGEVLKLDFMEPLALSSTALARALGVTPARINEIVRCRRGITAETALRLGRYFGTDAQSWMNLQDRYELAVAERRVGDALAAIRAAGCRVREGTARSHFPDWKLIPVALALVHGAASAQAVVDLPTEDRPLSADFPEVYRIGDGMDDRELLSRVNSLGFDASGNLYISDLLGQELEILVVDSGGELVTRFGRRGGGPGEFNRATEAFALADGRIVVADRGILAYHIFGPDRTFERRVRYPGVGEVVVLTPLRRPSGADPRLRKVDRWRGGLVLRITDVWKVQMDSLTREGSVEVVPGPREVLRVDLGGENAAEEMIARGTNPDREAPFLFGPLPGGAVAFSDSSDYAIRIAESGGGGHPHAAPPPSAARLERPDPRRIQAVGGEESQGRGIDEPAHRGIPELGRRCRQGPGRLRRDRADRRDRPGRGAGDHVGGNHMGGPDTG